MIDQLKNVAPQLLIVFILSAVICDISRAQDMTFRADVARTGVYDTDAPLGLDDTLWETDTSTKLPPAISNGTIYLVPGQSGFGGSDLIALNSVNGESRWSFTADAAISSPPSVSSGTVYFGTADGNLHAVDSRNGGSKWSFSVHDRSNEDSEDSGTTMSWGLGSSQSGAEENAEIRSSPAVSNGTIYFGSMNGNMYAVDQESGQENWSFETGDEIISPPAVADGIVYFTSRDENLYALDQETGQKRWSFDISVPPQFVSQSFQAPSVLDGTVYISTRIGLYALDSRTGREEWYYDYEDNTGVGSSPVVTEDMVYVVAGDLYAISRQTGQERWQWSPGEMMSPEGDFVVDVERISSSPVLADGVVYVMTTKDVLYAIGGDRGQEISSFNDVENDSNSTFRRESLRRSPVLVDGIIYIPHYSFSALLYRAVQ